MDVVGQGRTAAIYAWDDGRVLKLFQEWMPREAVEVEAQNTRVAQENGLPVPKVYEIVQEDGRYGLIYERVDGPTMLHVLTSKPWSLITMARQLADLHAQMHEVQVEQGLTGGHERYRQRIQRADSPDEVKIAALKRLDELGGGSALCHGDFHPDNILMTARGPMMIDWLDASRGNPVGDVARTMLLLTAGEPLIDVSRMKRWVTAHARQTFAQTYLKRYVAQRRIGMDEIAAWELPIVAARLYERIEAERAAMLARARGLAGIR